MRHDDLHISSNREAIDALRSRVIEPNPRVVLIVGSGVSYNATGKQIALWKGLLLNGIDYLIKEEKLLNPDKLEDLRTNLTKAFEAEAFDFHQVLKFAGAVEDLLNWFGEEPYSDWLSSVFQDLECLETENAKAQLEAIKQMHAAGCIVATTNYDDLLRKYLDVPVITWMDKEGMLEVMTGQGDGILHLHGHWDDPKSVILGNKSYDRVVRDEEFQKLFETLWLTNTWLYCGAGGGLDDKNFSRLLAWSKRWAKRSLPDFLLAKEDDAADFRKRTDLPANVQVIGYEDHPHLAPILRYITPSIGPSPFEPITEGYRHFGTPGADNIFPTRAAYLNGEVPTLHLDEDLIKQISKHGWASVIAGAGVGKTSLAMRLACSPTYRDRACYRIELQPIGADYGEPPKVVIRRLDKAGVLFIIDNAHQDPNLAWQLLSDWRLRRKGSHMLLLFTRLTGISTGKQRDPGARNFEDHTENPSLPLVLEYGDLRRIANFHIRQDQAGNRRRDMPVPNQVAIKWKELGYCNALNVFVIALKASMPEISNGDWSLPRSRVAPWVRKHWLAGLDDEELENLACISAFADQAFEMTTNSMALPYPERMEKLVDRRLAYELHRGKHQLYRHYALVEPEWGSFILEAMRMPGGASAIRINSSRRHLTTFVIFDIKLRLLGEEGQRTALWSAGEEYADGLLSSLSNTAARALLRFIKQAEERGSQLAVMVWNKLEIDSEALQQIVARSNLEWTWSLISYAKYREGVQENIWMAVEPAWDSLKASAWNGTLDTISSFLKEARSKVVKDGKDVADRLWADLSENQGRLLDTAWNGSLDSISSFLKEAKGKVVKDGRDLADRLLADLSENQGRLLDTAWNGSLDSISSFQKEARGKVVKDGRDLADRLWADLSENQGRLLDTAWNGSLASISSFLKEARGKVLKDGKHLADRLWTDLSENQGRLLDTAWNGSLDSISSFLKEARGKVEKDGKDLADRLWADLSENQGRLLDTAWNGSLASISSFLKEARGKVVKDGKDLADRLWADLSENQGRLLDTAWNGSLDSIGSFVEAAHEQGRELGWFWFLLESDTEGCAKLGFNASTKQFPGLGNHAPKSFLIKLLRDIVPGHWRNVPSRGSLEGAFWAISRSLEADRPDIADDLLDYVLLRSDPSDFPVPNGNFLAACRIAAMAKDKARLSAITFLESICTADNWLKEAYDKENIGQLATGLRSVSLSLGKEGGVLLQSGRLHRRLATEFEGRATKDPIALALALQLLGCAELIRWYVKPSLLTHVNVSMVQVLPERVLPHRDEATRVESYQYQLWLGLRSFASIKWQSIPCSASVLDKTLQLWRANQEYSSQWPDSFGHKLDDEMVRWLEDCLLNDVPAIVPSSKPLWRITGF